MLNKEVHSAVQWHNVTIGSKPELVFALHYSDIYYCCQLELEQLVDESISYSTEIESAAILITDSSLEVIFHAKKPNIVCFQLQLQGFAAFLCFI